MRKKTITIPIPEVNDIKSIRENTFKISNKLVKSARMGIAELLLKASAKVGVKELGGADVSKAS